MRRASIATGALAMVAVTAFAGNSLLARAALGGGETEPGAFTAIRLGAGALVLLPWLLRRPRSAAFSWHGALTLFVYCAPFSFAYVELSAATGAMVLFAVVQASMLASSALAGQRVHAADIVGIAFALLGA